MLKDDILYFIMEHHKKFHEYPDMDAILASCGKTRLEIKRAVAELKQDGYLERSLYVEKTKRQKTRKKNAR